MEGVTPVALQSVLDLVNELVYDKVDAILVDGGVAQQYADANPDLVIAEASAREASRLSKLMFSTCMVRPSSSATYWATEMSMPP